MLPATGLREQAIPANGTARTLTAMALLLDMTDGLDLVRFMQHDLVRLLDHLSRRTERVRTEQRGRVRGRIDWPATRRARYGGDYDPARFVCTEVHRQFDTPENQLLRFLLAQIRATAQTIPSELRAGHLILHSSEKLHGDALFRRPATVETMLRHAQRNIYLRQVTLPEQVTVTHRHRANVVELNEYRKVLVLHEHIVRRLDAVGSPAEQEYLRARLQPGAAVAGVRRLVTANPSLGVGFGKSRELIFRMNLGLESELSP